MSITINTTEYQFSHCHAPRGRGMWLFEIIGGTSPYSAPNYYNASAGRAALTYARARQYAVAEAKRLGAHTVKVSG